MSPEVREKSKCFVDFEFEICEREEATQVWYRSPSRVLPDNESKFPCYFNFLQYYSETMSILGGHNITHIHNIDLREWEYSTK